MLALFLFIRQKNIVDVVNLSEDFLWIANPPGNNYYYVDISDPKCPVSSRALSYEESISLYPFVESWWNLPRCAYLREKEGVLFFSCRDEKILDVYYFPDNLAMLNALLIGQRLLFLCLLSKR